MNGLPLPEIGEEFFTYAKTEKKEASVVVTQEAALSSYRWEWSFFIFA